MVTFSDAYGNAAAPAFGATINSQTYPYVPSRPQMMMFYDDMFVFRPVPDQAYPVTFKVYRRPSQLLSAGQSPDIEQWWEWYAYGASMIYLKIILDYDTVNLIQPEYDRQERLALRKTIVQNSTQRTSTIYVTTNGRSGFGSGWNFNGF